MNGADPLKRLAASDFAEMFGSTVDLIPESCMEQIRGGDWGYQVISGKERDAIIVDILNRIDERKFAIVSNEDKSRWLKGWGENLADFRNRNGDVRALTPKYIRAGQPIRLLQQFVRTTNPNFEEVWYGIFRSWFFKTYLSGFDHIFEFGCGSAHNIVELATLYPNARIYGLDWAQPSVEIVNHLRDYNNINVTGRLFDFFYPDYGLDIPPNSAVLTMGAIEQTDVKWGPFLNFLLAKKPRCVFHVEPVYEWYDPADIVDYTAAKAHLARNFCKGYWEKLTSLEHAGTVKILRKRRTGFGSLMMEGYSQIIWSPVQGVHA